MSQKQQNKDSPTFFENLTNYELDFSRYDQSEYSFDQKLAKISKKSIIMLIFNTFRAFVAIGILTLPYGISKVGPLLGFLTLMFIGFLVAITTLILMEIADESKFKGANLEILGKLLWGNAGHKIIIGLLVMACIVAFIGGILFSVDFLDFAFCSHHVEILCHSKKVFLLIALIASILIISIESLKPFGYVSIFATFIILVGFISITTYNLIYVVSSEDDLSEKLTYFNISGFFQFFGLAFYTTEGIGLLIPLRASFNDRTSFNKIFMGTYTLIMWTYTVLAILSYVVSQKVIWFSYKKYYIFQLQQQLQIYVCFGSHICSWNFFFQSNKYVSSI